MRLSLVQSRALLGLQAPSVTVEVHLANGLPSFTLVGLADIEVKEARERVRSALQNSGFEFPNNQRITVNLAPADLPKEGGRFDLPIALGILAASGQVDAAKLAGWEFAGELSLSGELRPVRGALAMSLVLRQQQVRTRLVLPPGSAEEAALVPTAEVYLAAVVSVVTGPVGLACALALASTTAPFADLQNAVIVASALNLPTSTQCSDLAGSTRAGLSALAQALESGAEGDALVVAADRRSAKPGSAQEMQFGAGAAAIQVGEDASLAKYLGRETVSHLFVDHFRATGEKHDYYWEERWIRDEGVAKVIPAAVKRLLAKTGRAATDVKWFGLAGAPSGSDKAIAKTLGIAPEQVLPDLHATVGDCGTAHAPLQLIHALENAKAGDLIIVAAFGQGCEVLAFEMGEGTHRPATGLAKSIAAPPQDIVEQALRFDEASAESDVDDERSEDRLVVHPVGEEECNHSH